MSVVERSPEAEVSRTDDGDDVATTAAIPAAAAAAAAAATAAAAAESSGGGGIIEKAATTKGAVAEKETSRRAATHRRIFGRGRAGVAAEPGGGKGGEGAMTESLSASVAARLAAPDCCHRLRTDSARGLSHQEAAARRRFHGANEFEAPEPEPLWKKYCEQFRNPLILLLLASALVSVLMRQFDDAISIAVAVIIVVTVGFVQEHRSERVLEQLKKLVPPTCTLVRDGREETVEARELVPGDVVVLSTGDRVPADIRLVEAWQLEVDESSLTGETRPRVKNTNVQANGGPQPGATGSDVAPSLDQLGCIVFMGTLVVSGRARGIVISSAAHSQFGDILRLISEEEAPRSPLQLAMDELGKQLSIYSFAIIGLIFGIGLYQGRDPLEMFTIGVSLAVAAIPEGLPIVVAVTLAIGVQRMAGRRAVIRRLPAVETLGCVTVICADKTGTLTTNRMTASRLVTANGTIAEVTGTEWPPTSSSSPGEVLVDGQPTSGHTHADVATVVEAALLCNNAAWPSDGGTPLGQPTEAALLVLAAKMHLDGMRAAYSRRDELPFTHEGKWMAVDCVSHAGEPICFAKGAPERLFPLCASWWDAATGGGGGGTGGAGSPRRWDDARRAWLEAEARGMAAAGLRVLAVARGPTRDQLSFCGLIGIHDPPRPNVPSAVRAMQSTGVEVKMLTGDAHDTALSIAQKVGIYEPGASIMAGDKLDKISDEELAKVVKQVAVFYRVSPRHKLRIVKAIQSTGRDVVAMTGDGVNDAAALKKADIGVAMGLNGTDTAKEAADMVLVDDDFSTICAAVEEGKAIYQNIRNFVRFQLSTSVSALSLIALSTLFHFANPLNAMQILFINIIMDGPPAQSLGVEPMDQDVVRQRPRDTRRPMLDRQLLSQILMSATVMIAGTLTVFYKELSADGEITPRDTTMTFACFVLFDMWNALSCRSATKPVWEIGLFRNRVFCAAVGGSLLCLLGVIYWAPLQSVFQTEALSFYDLLFLVTLSSSVFVVNETRKLWTRIRTTGGAGRKLQGVAEL